MMKWGRKKPVSSSSSSSSSGLSWFSKFNTSSDLKPAKENKKKKNYDDEAAKSSLSSTKPRSNSFRGLKENAVATRKSTTDMESDEKFEEIMSSVRKKVRDFQIETRGGGGFLNVEDKGGTLMIMTPRIRDKPRFERRDPKLLEQKPPQRSKPPTRRTSTGREDSEVLGQTVTKPGHQWQMLKETKLREVKVKADLQQRKSLYMRRELNSSKVRVFSPRATEKCRVKAIEDFKKARAREDGDRGGTTTETESFAVVKCSNDPRKDFRDSMIEMIMENGINHPEELKELLVCYLRLNTDEYHDMIIKVFQQVYSDLNFHYFGVE